jgi:hypothetical protein
VREDPIVFGNEVLRPSRFILLTCLLQNYDCKIMLNIVLCGCKTCSLTLLEGCRKSILREHTFNFHSDDRVGYRN